MNGLFVRDISPGQLKRCQDLVRRGAPANTHQPNKKGAASFRRGGSQDAGDHKGPHSSSTPLPPLRDPQIFLVRLMRIMRRAAPAPTNPVEERSEEHGVRKESDC